MTSSSQQSGTDQLLQRARTGTDPEALRDLLERHRGRLERMLAVHMDRRLRARIDPSDVIQETLLQAAGRLQQYLRDRPLPFYPWLRHLAWEQLMHLHAHHLRTAKRNVTREAASPPAIGDRPMLDLAEQLAASITSPSGRVVRDELRRRLRAALVRLSAGERDVLVLRYLEQLQIREIAAVLGITEAAATKRHIRGLAHLRDVLRPVSTG